ncbi:MAG: RIP metalloprotease RseP [Patescibacteria group bacterium]|jgi:regulator of sigma E protease
MLFTIIIFILVLSVLVFVHEFGHFIVARRFGVKAEEFGFGFPPRGWGIYKSKSGKWKQVFGNKPVTDAVDTVYSLNWIPLGGFVKIKGELGPSDGSVLGEVPELDGGEDSFWSKKIWQRVLIISAGVIMNVILAAVLLSIGYGIGLPQVLGEKLSSGAVVTGEKIQIVEIMPKTPAEEAALQVGDIILSVEGNKFTVYEDLQAFVNERLGKPLNYKIQRGGEIFDRRVTPKILGETGKPGIGVGIAETGIVSYPWYEAIYQGARSAIELIGVIIIAFYGLIKSLLMHEAVSGNVAGPVGIAVLTGQVARMGFVYLLQFTALLSINLAVINFLPIPALDGGRVLFLIIEKIKGKPVKRELEAIIHNIGFVILMLFVLFITFQDVAGFKDQFIHLWQRVTGL